MQACCAFIGSGPSVGYLIHPRLQITVVSPELFWLTLSAPLVGCVLRAQGASPGLTKVPIVRRTFIDSVTLAAFPGPYIKLTIRGSHSARLLFDVESEISVGSMEW